MDRDISLDTCLIFASHFIADFSNELYNYPVSLKARFRDLLPPIDQQLCVVIDSFSRNEMNEVAQGINSLQRNLDELGDFIASKEASRGLISEGSMASLRARSIVLLILREHEFRDSKLEECLAYLSEEKTSGLHLFYLRYLVSRSLILTVNSYIEVYTSGKSYWNFEVENEYRSGTVSLLSFFQEVLTIKYPELEPEVSVLQKSNSIRLVVDINSSDTALIESEFIEYGKVVVGERLPEEYLDDRMKVLALENKLDLVKLELKQAKQLLTLEKEHSSSRIDYLEDQLQYMQNIFSSKLESTSVFEELAKDQSEVVKKALSTIEKIVAKGIQDSDRELVLNELSKVKDEDASILDKLNDYVLKGAIQGAAGNFLHRWLSALSTLI